MHLSKNIKHFVGAMPGPKVAIMGSLHGNEQIGKQIIDQLAVDLESQEIKGEVFLIFGNPKAYKANLRFLTHDMNRLFTLDFLSKASDKLDYEEYRVLEICEVLNNVDYLLDIHSTQKASVAFVYCELDDEHLELARIFDTKFIVGTAPYFKPKERSSSADNYVDKKGGVGITFEAGWNKDDSLFEQTLAKVKEYLSCVGSCFSDLTVRSGNPIVLEIYEHLLPTSECFKLLSDFKNFDFVKADTLVAKDGNFSLSCLKDSYVVFPKTQFFVGKAACYFASIKYN